MSLSLKVDRSKSNAHFQDGTFTTSLLCNGRMHEKLLKTKAIVLIFISEENALITILVNGGCCSYFE